MGTGAPSRSIRGSLIMVVMLITTSSLAIALGINQYFDYQTQRQDLLEQLQTLAKLTADHAQDTIVDNKPALETRQLRALSVYKFLQSAQTYQLDRYTQQLNFFAGYTRSGVLPNTFTDSQLRALKQPRITADTIEITSEISFEGELLGFSYLRISLDTLNQRLWNNLYQALTIILVASIFALLITLQLQRRFSQPIDTLISLVQQVDLNKDYALRAPTLEVQELDFLGNAFNRMLSRVSRRLEKQQQAEQEIRQLNQSLEDKVTERTFALKQANSELLQTLEKLHLYQGQMLEKEKLHKLGQMVAGIAHELDTPLGLGITTSTSMQQALSELKHSLEHGELSQRRLNQFLSLSDEAFNILTRNLQRACQLIESFKHVAVDQCSEQDRTFEVHHFIDEVLLTLKPKLKKSRHIIEVICDQELTITSKPGAISQILINLVLNSLKHGFKDISQGTIVIQVTMDKDYLTVIYEDNGRGMSQEVKAQVFSPYFTTAKESGGSGLGMYIVQSLVQQVLGGKLELETEPEQGIRLKMMIPLTDTETKQPSVADTNQTHLLS
ncbi:HAMP domain-containing histidine kinase [Corallincola luteus]|uniref:histidine kinase n=1 Tax=Corallincola luteus TaxID=1775177 RepID=A0ABY2ANM5_9GAMM|nr:HAMP domain-containing sensor histidine kinase [Corallincola luteus]TCI04800.1 HAMP domain-containing histidine kinase [Corallincola luteus]